LESLKNEILNADKRIEELEQQNTQLNGQKKILAEEKMMK